MSTSVSSTTSTTTTGSTSSSTAALGADLNTFLTMLTTQLQNQDPTNPLDTNEMTNQLVQFASVEQQIQMNQNLTSLIDLQQTAQLTAAAPLLGRQVEVTSDQLALQNGSAEIRLPAAGTATSAVITITNSAGTVLRTQTVSLGTGATSWTWDGKNTAGVTQADGAYNVAVAGRDANGASTSVSFTVRGTLTGAERSDGSLNLNMGSVSVPFSNLLSVLPTS